MTKQHSKSQELFSTLKWLCIAIVIRILIFEPYYVPSESMMPGLKKGDYLMGTKYDYGYGPYSLAFGFDVPLLNTRLFHKEPQVGDVIIFRAYKDRSIMYIKRLIGKQGDRIRMMGGVLYINGSPIKRTAIKDSQEYEGYDQYIETLPNGVQYKAIYKRSLDSASLRALENSQEFVVPENHYFFMGDNRYESADSRFDLGFVPANHLVAKARFIYLSTPWEMFNKNTELLSFDQLKSIILWFGELDFSRIGIIK